MEARDEQLREATEVWAAMTKEEQAEEVAYLMRGQIPPKLEMVMRRHTVDLSPARVEMARFMVDHLDRAIHEVVSVVAVMELVGLTAEHVVLELSEMAAGLDAIMQTVNASLSFVDKIEKENEVGKRMETI